MGRRCPPPAIGGGAFLALVVLFAVAGREVAPFTPPSGDPQAIGIMLTLWVIALGLHKIAAALSRNHVPSYHDGQPWLWRRGGMGELSVKRFAEPLLCLGFGWVMSENAYPLLGAWWMACGVATAFTAALGARYLENLALDRLDAEARAEFLEAWTDRHRPPNERS